MKLYQKPTEIPAALKRARELRGKTRNPLKKRRLCRMRGDVDLYSSQLNTKAWEH